MIGSHVVRLRRAKGFKQKDLLLKLQTLGMDISVTALSRLEGQSRSVNDFELLYLCKALDVELEELLQG